MTRRKNTPAIEPDKQAKVKSFFKSEWPLLLYPVLVVAAIVLLQMVDRSIEKDLTPSPRQQHPHTSTTTTLERGPLGASETAVGEDGSTPDTGWAAPSSDAATTPDTDQAADRLRTIEALRDRAGSATSEGFAFGAAESQELQGINGILADLRKAVQSQDHSRIKQAMDDLVALGDEVVGPLSDLVASGTDEAALWAAEALARIGTPTATAALFDTLAQIRDGHYKEQVAKTASNISNHDSWPLLLDTFQDTKDATVQRAAGASLSKMADTPVLDEIIARYDAALTEEEAAHLAQLVGNINSPGANESLRALAGSVSGVPLDSLQQAAIDALANVADAQSVSFLLSQLEAASPGEGGSLFNTVANISSPQAHSALLYAAAGSKDVSAEQGRAAAIYALENYPSVETCVLLEQIVASEDNIAVVTAALRTLENIQKAVPSAVEKVASKADSGTLLSVDPLQK
ncbi:HEAT repeat domain-containing protein [Anaerobaca lacustris]|uniref:HEAT repeat domain-containing protein n=1 Tax=Anaerobaca lacustris TaxID=3044600 RepID=A0AAW6TXP9_9BACT|nr:HEAT repeat domain-containing protein [Sedimentisphaerales bacterium M17dextr]